MIKEGAFEGALGIIYHREEEITLEYINDLIGVADNGSDEYRLLSELYDVCNDMGMGSTSSDNPWCFQIDSQYSL